MELHRRCALRGAVCILTHEGRLLAKAVAAFPKYNQAMQALYVHIPFCVRKCGYCDFYSEAGSEQEAQRYLAALERELEMRVRELGPVAPNTVFFGGGTPTKLTAPQLTQLGQLLHRHVDLSGVREWTSEINPGTLTADKANALAEMGVNRASLGVQSFNPRILALLDRSHEAGKVSEALRLVRAAGIRNINMDLMFSIPSQTFEELTADLAEAFGQGTQHVSLYSLMYEDGTPLTGRMESGEIEPVDPDTEAEFYRETVARAQQAGFERYEVSNFARPARECQHNLVYWRSGDWLGIGPAAHSARGKQRWGNCEDHREYARALLDEGRFPVTMDETSTPERYADELLMMGLRLTEGVNALEFKRKCGFSIEDRCGPALDEMERMGLMAFDGRTLKLTAQGFLVLDSVLLELTRAPMRLA